MAQQSDWEKEQEVFGKLVKAAAKALVQHLPQGIIEHTAERLIRSTLENIKTSSYELTKLVTDSVHLAIREKVQELLSTKYKGQMDEIAGKAAEKVVLEMARKAG